MSSFYKIRSHTHVYVCNAMFESINTVYSSYNDHTHACAYLYHSLILSLEFASKQINELITLS